MAEDKKKSEKNNSGFSLVELIIVIAIVAALITTVFLSVSMVFSANAKACSNDLQRAIADCKVTTMGKARAWLVIYRGSNNRVYSQMHIMEQVEGEEIGTLADIPQEPQKLGGNRVVVTYTDSAGVDQGDLPETGITIEFDRSSGSFKDGTPQSIDVIGGNRHYHLVFVKLTGKVSVEQIAD